MECLNSFDCHDQEEKVLFFIICNKEEKEDKKKTGGISRILKDLIRYWRYVEHMINRIFLLKDRT